MKKLIPSLVLLCALGWGTLGYSQTMFRNQAANITIDGQQVMLDQPALVIGDRVMVPLRGVFENLGATVVYHPEDRSIVATRGNSTVMLYLNSTTALVNGDLETLSSPPLAMNSRILVPLRFVSEALGAEVHWAANTQTVNIESRTGGVDLPYAPNDYAPNNYGTAQEPHLIRSVDVTPHILPANDVVTVTVLGVPNSKVTIHADRRNIAMREVSLGVYRGSFLASPMYAGIDKAGNEDLEKAGYEEFSISLQTPDGQTQTMDRTGDVRVMP